MLLRKLGFVKDPTPQALRDLESQFHHCSSLDLKPHIRVDNSDSFESTEGGVFWNGDIYMGKDKSGDGIESRIRGFRTSYSSQTQYLIFLPNFFQDLRLVNFNIAIL